MVRDTACRSVLITVSVLLVCPALGSAQSGKRGQRDPRGVNVVPSTPPAASPERRVALVIGNAAYQYTAPLTNPLNDAQDMARVLKDSKAGGRIFAMQTVSSTGKTVQPMMAIAILRPLGAMRAVRAPMAHTPWPETSWNG